MTTLLEPETDLTAEEIERFKAFAESRFDPVVERTPTPSRALVASLKQADQDHEFYPTTAEILRALCRDIGIESTDKHDNRRRGTEHSSALDIGAGNGKVLLALRDQCGINQLHAIEKSSILCRELDASILIVGTEFHEQSLFSKQVDIITCNPPYSQFEEWAEKIIRQAASKVVYLIIPQRWEKSVRIADALKFRGVALPGAKGEEVRDKYDRYVKTPRLKIIGAFDFEDAEDRAARAKVHLLRIDLPEEKDDAFERFFKEQFADLIGKFDAKKTDDDGEAKKDEHQFGSLVIGPNYPETLVALYRAEMDNIERNYHLVSQLDASLLKEFDVTPKRIMACLKARLSGLKHDYWNELFSHLKAVTDRLTSGSRKSLLGTLQKHVEVDFTVPNILEVVVWVIKNANNYIESQLIETYEHMVSKCNVTMYKSNQKTWQDGGWRYGKGDALNTHFALDYRIVTHSIGGITSGYSSNNGLEERANEFLGDLMTIARNLGFNCHTADGRVDRWCRGMKWVSGGKEEFNFLTKQGNAELLFDVRAFGNGNLHLRLNKAFILALNVEHGRLKGWLKTPQEAATELNDPEAAKHFKTNVQLLPDSGVLLLSNRQ